ncbi:hypothetical protein SAMN05421810_11434 [Amycolatopsis arida]|uniref:IrrE N-terminal-like domain-containing protein n=1 Tax=Amycolatopsis arida TaxID=587909 RepID=A0A1I6ARF4_9PSEU|nr:hypothetical protein [Amycolatopsis arida]TDX97589.1 hypothetical protein CLV69_102693 [Amycolatopsis arida]SFQ71254.1 hypothetical protein SAMN05421810_11434 [Amycolatopsis arida]
MASRHVRSLAGKLVARLPDLPRPWDVEVLCQELARNRSRPLLLHPVDIPAFPFGMWYDDGVRDHVFYRSSASGYYRDHIVLHEICHMLAGHGVPTEDVLADQVDAAVPGVSFRGASGRAYNNHEEELAETFAAMVLRMARQRRPGSVSAVERRAEELFGATRT